MRVQSVLILGAGTIGQSLAELMALNGLDVELWDYQAKSLGKASAMIERAFFQNLKYGVITTEELEIALSRIRLISDLKITNPSNFFVIEAVVENLEIKQNILGTIEKILPHAYLGTSTSSLSIRQISDSLKNPEKLFGLHFSNCSSTMSLVELIYSPITNITVLAEVQKFLEEQIKKKVILVRDAPGFTTSRLVTSIALEAMRMVEQNIASIEDIDKAMEYGYHYPMGPLKQSDWIGLDIRLQTAKSLYIELNSEVFRPPSILESLVSEGKYGKKTGQGFYKWPMR